MSIEAKKVLLGQVEDKLRVMMTAAQMDDVLGVIADVMTGYSVEQSDDTPMVAGNRELLDAFLNAKRLEGRTQKTIDRYQYILGGMLDSINVELHRISVYHLRSYLAEKKGGGCSDSTLDGIRSVFSSFFGWVHKEGLIRVNPCANLGTIKAPKVERIPYSVTDIERMREACATKRDIAILQFLLSTGCRISEAVSVNRRDVDFQTLEVKVMGKGRKERTVYIDTVCAMHLSRYLTERGDQSEALFTGKGTDRMTAQGVRAMLKRLEETCGVGNIHPHRFRRTLATNLINHGMSLQEVAAILGHENVDTTMKYVYTNRRTVKNSYMKVVG